MPAPKPLIERHAVVYFPQAVPDIGKTFLAEAIAGSIVQKFTGTSHAAGQRHDHRTEMLKGGRQTDHRQKVRDLCTVTSEWKSTVREIGDHVWRVQDDD